MKKILKELKIALSTLVWTVGAVVKQDVMLNKLFSEAGVAKEVKGAIIDRLLLILLAESSKLVGDLPKPKVAPVTVPPKTKKAVAPTKGAANNIGLTTDFSDTVRRMFRKGENNYLYNGVVVTGGPARKNLVIKKAGHGVQVTQAGTTLVVDVTPRANKSTLVKAVKIVR